MIRISVAKISLAMSVGALTLLPLAASAHFLKTDGDIGAVIHIDPNDSPLAGQATTLYFDIKDKKSLFSIAACSCTISVLHDGTELFRAPVTQVDDTTVTGGYTFPKAGVYQVKLVGIPTSGSGFQSFSMLYDIRAEGGSAQPNGLISFFNTYWIYAVGVAVVVMTIIVQGFSVRRKDGASPKNK